MAEGNNKDKRKTAAHLRYHAMIDRVVIFLEDANIGSPKLVAFRDLVNLDRTKYKLDYLAEHPPKSYSYSAKVQIYVQRLITRVTVLEELVEHKKLTMLGYAEGYSEATQIFSDLVSAAFRLEHPDPVKQINNDIDKIINSVINRNLGRSGSQYE